MTRIARFRLGSEMREKKYWEVEEKRMQKKCRLFGWEEESWKHVEIYTEEGQSGGKEEILRILENNERGED